MFDWLHAIGRRLCYFIVHVTIDVAGPAMILIGALDSSLLSLPEVNDYLVVARCYTHPETAYLFPLFPAIGSLIGCFLLYTVLRRGGQAVLRRRFRIDHVQRVERVYARFGILALAVPALVPPPMPFKIFVATAGALQFPRRRFLVTILLARSLRYYVEGTLAVFYGQRVARFLQANGIIIVSVVGGICLIALAIYLLSGKGRAAVELGKETR
ncbi:MAG TPA: VTT domain-containing protein [Pyrinomonadaceae bacterium]|nr:VTT domain-containing protein [Pyrinomonadaceae bacterium]